MFGILAYIGIFVCPVVLGIKTRKWFIGAVAFFLEVVAIMELEGAKGFYKYFAIITWSIILLFTLGGKLIRNHKLPFFKWRHKLYKKIEGIELENSWALKGGIALLLLGLSLFLAESGYDKIFIYSMVFIIVLFIIIGFLIANILGVIIVIVIAAILLKPIELLPIPFAILFSVGGIGLMAYCIIQTIKTSKEGKHGEKGYVSYQATIDKYIKNYGFNKEKWTDYKTQKPDDSFCIDNMYEDVTVDQLEQIKEGTKIGIEHWDTSTINVIIISIDNKKLCKLNLNPEKIKKIKNAKAFFIYKTENFFDEDYGPRCTLYVGIYK